MCQALSRGRLGPWPLGALTSVDTKHQMVTQIDAKWLRCRVEDGSHSCSDGGCFGGSRVKMNYAVTAGCGGQILVAWTRAGSGFLERHMWETVFRGLSDVLGVECVRGEGMSQVTTGVQLGYQMESQSLRQRMLKDAKRGLLLLVSQSLKYL